MEAMYKQVILHRKLRVYAELLGQVAQQVPVAPVQRKDIPAVQRDGAGGGFHQGGQHTHQGGLACAVDAQQAIDTPAQGVADMIHGIDAAEGFGQFCQFQLHIG